MKGEQKLRSHLTCCPGLGRGLIKQMEKLSQRDSETVRCHLPHWDANRRHKLSWHIHGFPSSFWTASVETRKCEPNLLCLTICEVPLWGRKYYLSGSLPKLGKWPANRCLLNRWCFKLSWSKTVFNFKRGNCNKCQGDGSICNFPDKTNFLDKLSCNLQILIAQNSFSVIYY